MSILTTSIPTIVSDAAKTTLDTTKNVLNTTVQAVDNISSGAVKGISEVAKGADNLISDSSKGLGKVISSSGEIVGKVGTNIGKTVSDIGNLPKDICSTNFSINVIIILIFGYYLYTKMVGMNKENVNILIEGLVLGIVLSTFLHMSMFSFKKNNRDD